jgi:hypothetical protein
MTSKELNIQSVIITAANLSPQSYSQFWFIKNELLKEDEFLADSVFSPKVVQVLTKDFLLIIHPNQIALNFNKEFDASGIINLILPKIVEKSSGVSFQEVGINFEWIVTNTDKDLSSWSRENFANNKVPFINFFGEDNAKFGFYASKDFLNARLKLNITPIHALKQTENPETAPIIECLQASFNFHCQPPANANFLESTCAFLQDWGKYYDESKRIIATL